MNGLFNGLTYEEYCLLGCINGTSKKAMDNTEFNDIIKKMVKESCVNYYGKSL